MGLPRRLTSCLRPLRFKHVDDIRFVFFFSDGNQQYLGDLHVISGLIKLVNQGLSGNRAASSCPLEGKIRSGDYGVLGKHWPLF